MLDTVFRGGLVVDGSGRAPYRADVGIKGSRIAAIGSIDHSGEQEIDIGGLVIAPGFIDTHGHSDFSFSVCPQATSHLVQGFTTQIVGNCGFSVFPLYPENRGLFIDPPSLQYDWNTLDEFVDRVGSIGINAVPLAGHSTIRQLVVGEDRPVRPQELELMKDRLRQALDMGAFGMSTGLVYSPAPSADAAELSALLAVVAEYGGIHASHIRSYAPGSIWPAIEEALSLSFGAGVPCVLSHLVLHARGNWGMAEHLLTAIDSWRRRGLRVHSDSIAFPKLGPWWGPSVIFRELYDSSLPWDEGADLLAKQIRDNPEKMRQEVQRSLEADKSTFWGQFFGLHDWGTLELVEVSPGSPWQKHTGRSFEVIASDTGMDPTDLLFELIEQERGDLIILTRLVRPEDHALMVQDPYFMFGSDLRATAPDAVKVKGVGGITDQRLYGEAIEVLAGLARDRGVLSLAEAVRKLSGLPADCFGLRDRGTLRPGLAADITVFDYYRLAIKATIRKPHTFPEGMHHVLVNGRFAVRDGQPTGDRAGRVLLRPS